MAQPTGFTRQFNFNDFQTTSPSTPLPGVQLDNELNATKTNLDGLNANIAKIQRDDGLLANQSVHKNSFDVDALALIGLSGYTVSGDWAASNSYTAGTLVNFNDATYLATVAHTSASAFATDQAAGKWILLANAAISTTGASVDKFEGNGTQTAFTLSLSYSSNTDMLVFVNGALRNPGDDYNVSGTTLTFSTAPSAPSVSGNENVIIWGANVATQAAITAANTASSNASGFATTAQDYAIKVDGAVSGTSDFSSKAQAVGGTNVTGVTGSAREWAIGGGSTPNATVHVDSGDEYSAKGYAVGAIDRGQSTGKHSAKDWATYTGGTVDGSGFSAKYWAQTAASSVQTIDTKYFGALASDPTQNPDGSALEVGDIYYSSSSSNMRVWDGTAWLDVAVSTSSFASAGFSIAMSIAL
jgi:hypothetical protein